MAAKDFGTIESDYAFFVAHATEAEQDVAAYAQALCRFAAGRAQVRMLDFGSGDGEFTERFLHAMHWPPEILELELVEPVEKQLRLAAQRVARFARKPIGCETVFPGGWERRFDLILSNHVLYYVTDLNETLRQLAAATTPNGVMLLAMAGWYNVLMQLWTAGFAQLGEPVPYHAAEDVEARLLQLGVSFEKAKCPYRLRFPDTRANRLKILRFLFADHLPRLSMEPLLAKFDRYAKSGEVDLYTHSYHNARSMLRL